MKTINTKMPLPEWYKVIQKKGLFPFWGIKIAKKAIRIYRFAYPGQDYNGNTGSALIVDKFVNIRFKDKLSIAISKPHDLRVMIYSVQVKEWTLVPNNEIVADDSSFHRFFKKNLELKYMSSIKIIYS